MIELYEEKIDFSEISLGSENETVSLENNAGTNGNVLQRVYKIYKVNLRVQVTRVIPRVTTVLKLFLEVTYFRS
jgi:hypothetical protein